MSQVVLVVAPHPDDEAIGCGGAIGLHHRRGDPVHVVFLTSGELSLKHLACEEAWRLREGEAEAAAGVLGVSGLTFLRLADWSLGERVAEAAESLRPVLRRTAPRLIYVPHAREWHPDHRGALAIVRRALGDAPEPLALRAYEVWTPLAEYDRVEDITPVMRQKLRAVRCYASQTAQFRYDRAVRGLNQYRGALAARCRYAEVFQAAPLRGADPGEGRPVPQPGQTRI
jgi:LmbE family N-acetylglucosaminyl deacetylase